MKIFQCQNFHQCEQERFPVEGNRSDSLPDIVKKKKKKCNQCNPLKENILTRKFPQQTLINIVKKEDKRRRYISGKNPTTRENFKGEITEV